MRLPRHLRLESTTRETRDWFLQWNRCWQIVRRAVVRAQLQAPQADQQPVLAELQAIDEDREKIVADLGITLAQADELPELSPFWGFTVPRGELACRSLVQGSNATQVVEYPAAQASSDVVGRWLLGLLVATLGSSLLIARRWLPATDWPLRNCRAIGVLIGIAWALWLWPAWFGWAIVLLFVWPQTWPQRRSATRDTGSAIVVRNAAENSPV
jgi:hypothetical protein